MGGRVSHKAKGKMKWIGTVVEPKGVGGCVFILKKKKKNKLYRHTKLYSYTDCMPKAFSIYCTLRAV